MAPRRPKTPTPNPTPEARLTLVMQPDLLERVRNAAFWTPGETLAAIGHRGIMAEVEKMEKKNGGVPAENKTEPDRAAVELIRPHEEKAHNKIPGR
jgi:hypothetical protein